jgi:F-type H+-transporting ATPase subunit c
MAVFSGSILAATGTSISALAIGAVMLGCAAIILAAAFAIGWIGSRAVESIARQPEAGARIFSTMVIAAALVEGITFFSLLICFLALYWMR